MSNVEVNHPKLSVAMITYNHEKFIEQALDSVLMQKVDFEYEIIIGDDISTDRTREILLRYQQQHPDTIRLLLYETKMGPGGNLYNVLHNCSGEYVALLEGDDYWSAPQKLQTQVDYLDAHPRCVLCSHPVEIYSENKREFVGKDELPTDKLSFDLADFLAGRFQPRLLASVYRRNAIILPKWIVSLNAVDIVLIMLLVHEGTLDLVNKFYAVYRIHDAGIWSGVNRAQAYVNSINSRLALSNFYNHQYDHYDKVFKFHWLYVNAARAFYTQGDIVNAKFYLSKAVKYTKRNPLELIALVKASVVIYANPVYKLGRRFTNRDTS